MLRVARSVFVLFFLPVAGASACAKKEASPTSDPVRVAAAADLATAFSELGQKFEAKEHHKVVFSFGSTGLLAKQISEGAPFDLFAAANVSFINDVVRAKQCDEETKTLYAQGRITLWSTEAARTESLQDLAKPEIRKVAIANPEHAPYGRAAKEALEKLGVWDAVSKKVVYGENVQQTLQFAQSGNADVAIVALSLAVSAKGGSHKVIEPGLYNRIDQALVVCGKNAARTEKAKAFAAFVNSAEGRDIMKRYGFLLPGE